MNEKRQASVWRDVFGVRDKSMPDVSKWIEYWMNPRVHMQSIVGII